MFYFYNVIALIIGKPVPLGRGRREYLKHLEKISDVLCSTEMFLSIMEKKKKKIKRLVFGIHEMLSSSTHL